MLQVQGQSLGQLPTDSTYNIRFSPQQVASQGECAAKGGTLFDSQRFCCVKFNGKTGAIEPSAKEDYGWFCAQTTFGAPVPKPGAPGAVPGAPGYYPPMYQTSMFGDTPSWLPVAAVAGGILLLLVNRRS